MSEIIDIIFPRYKGAASQSWNELQLALYDYAYSMSGLDMEDVTLPPVEINDWLIENAIWCSFRLAALSTKRAVARFGFETAKDAVAFRLRWG